MEILNYKKINGKKDEGLEKILSVLVPEFKPTAVYLFGSRAKGTAKKNCDYDFAVTTKTPKKSSLEEMARIRSLIFKNLNISADIFIYSEKEFEE